MSRYDMQAFRSREEQWERMVEGAAGKSHWRPRSTLTEAVEKCRRWAGLGQNWGDTCIPTMQVVDLETGEVVWRSESYDEVDAGPPITAELDTLF